MQLMAYIEGNYKPILDKISNDVNFSRNAILDKVNNIYFVIILKYLFYKIDLKNSLLKNCHGIFFKSFNIHIL